MRSRGTGVRRPSHRAHRSSDVEAQKIPWEQTITQFRWLTPKHQPNSKLERKENMKQIASKLTCASAFLAAALTTNARADTYPACDGWWTSDAGHTTYCPTPQGPLTVPNIAKVECAYVVYSPPICLCQPASGQFTDIYECWSVEVNGTETYWHCASYCTGTYPNQTCSCASPYSNGPTARTMPTVNFTLCQY
jgi:hypothetical protein